MVTTCGSPCKRIVFFNLRSSLFYSPRSFFRTGFFVQHPLYRGSKLTVFPQYGKETLVGSMLFIFLIVISLKHKAESPIVYLQREVVLSPLLITLNLRYPTNSCEDHFFNTVFGPERIWIQTANKPACRNGFSNLWVWYSVISAPVRFIPLRLYSLLPLRRKFKPLDTDC